MLNLGRGPILYSTTTDRTTSKKKKKKQIKFDHKNKSAALKFLSRKKNKQTLSTAPSSSSSTSLKDKKSDISRHHHHKSSAAEKSSKTFLPTVLTSAAKRFSLSVSGKKPAIQSIGGRTTSSIISSVGTTSGTSGTATVPPVSGSSSTKSKYKKEISSTHSAFDSNRSRARHHYTTAVPIKSSTGQLSSYSSGSRSRLEKTSKKETAAVGSSTDRILRALDIAEKASSGGADSIGIVQESSNRFQRRKSLAVPIASDILQQFSHSPSSVGTTASTVSASKSRSRHLTSSLTNPPSVPSSTIFSRVATATSGKTNTSSITLQQRQGRSRPQSSTAQQKILRSLGRNNSGGGSSKKKGKKSKRELISSSSIGTRSVTSSGTNTREYRSQQRRVVQSSSRTSKKLTRAEKRRLALLRGVTSAAPPAASVGLGNYLTFSTARQLNRRSGFSFEESEGKESRCQSQIYAKIQNRFTLPESLRKLLISKYDFMSSKVNKAIQEVKEDGAGASLDLVDRGILSLSNFPKLFECSNLMRLTLSHNKLDSLPENIDSFINLEILNLSNNQLESIPTRLSSLPKLRILSLAFNRLRTLPTGFGAFNNLQVLDLTYNNLNEMSLPSNFFCLTTLRALYLGDNDFEKFPREVISLSALQILVLRDNDLLTLPPELGSLALRELHIQGNRLQFLPPELGNLVLIGEKRIFKGDNNPWIPPIKEKFQKGLTQVFDYIRSAEYQMLYERQLHSNLAPPPKADKSKKASRKQ